MPQFGGYIAEEMERRISAERERWLKVVEPLVEALEDLSGRAKRLRKILRDSQPGNWGMLDTQAARAALSAAREALGAERRER